MNHLLGITLQNHSMNKTYLVFFFNFDFKQFILTTCFISFVKALRRGIFYLTDKCRDKAAPSVKFLE